MQWRLLPQEVPCRAATFGDLERGNKREKEQIFLTPENELVSTPDGFTCFGLFPPGDGRYDGKCKGERSCADQKPNLTSPV